MLGTVISVLANALRRRHDLVCEAIAQVVTVCVKIFTLLQSPRRLSGGTGAQSDRQDRTGPNWVSPSMAMLDDARSFGRYLSNLATIGSQHSSLSKHAPTILVAYVRAAADPWANLGVAARRELEPGLFAVCDIVTVGGRGGGRGREGEVLGSAFGLGEGVSGEAEKEIWAELWRAWGKKRYTGRG
jgi:hypothetical protein